MAGTEESTAEWLPTDYADVATLSGGLALEASLRLTRLLADQAEAAVQALIEENDDSARISAMQYDAVAGAAIHAGLFESALDVLDLQQRRQPPGERPEPTVMMLLEIKRFAANVALGRCVEAEAVGSRLLAVAAAEHQAAFAAMVWSGFGVLRSWRGDAEGVRECRREFDALRFDDPRIAEAWLGAAELLRVAEASLGDEPGVVHRELLDIMLRQAVPVRAMLDSARDVGRTLVTADHAVELTARRQKVLRLLAKGLTTAAIAHRLEVAPRTVQDDVAALKAIYGVTSRPALVGRFAAPSRSRSLASGRLTPRQREVVELVRIGYTTRGIADALGISPRTVEQHIAGACARVGVLSRAELATYDLQSCGRPLRLAPLDRCQVGPALV